MPGNGSPVTVLPKKKMSSSEATKVPDDLAYTKEHEWIKRDDSKCRIGVTDFAQDQLGDIVFIEYPDSGRAVSAGESIAVIESVKSVADVYAPFSGTITSSNSDADPAAINSDPYGDGWLFEMEVTSEEETLTSQQYREHIGSAE